MKYNTSRILKQDFDEAQSTVQDDEKWTLKQLLKDGYLWFTNHRRNAI
jgi:hypothetical protein